MDLRQYKFDLVKSPVDARDFMLETIYPESVTLPEEWDLRPQLRPIKDQGTQGTCSAQTISAIKEWQELVDINVNEDMSSQFVYNLRENTSTEGMYPRNTMEILHKIGIVLEKDYPYYTNKPITEELKTLAGKHKIEGYAQINTVESLNKALFANGPCYIAFPVYNPNKMDFWKPDHTGQQMMGGHAVCVAGYLKNSFIIRNSWSDQWGDRGYTYMPFTDWGFQWECWTAIDADSNPQSLSDKAEKYANKQGFFRRLFSKKIKK